MNYDTVISTKNRHEPKIEFFVCWCVKYEILIRIQKQTIHDKVTSVRNIVFKKNA